MSSRGQALSSDTSDEAEPSEKDPSVDEIYDILANRRRRYALHYLKQVDTRAEIGQMAEQIAAWENGKSIREVTSTERKYVYSAL